MLSKLLWGIVNVNGNGEREREKEKQKKLPLCRRGEKAWEDSTIFHNFPSYQLKKALVPRPFHIRTLKKALSNVVTCTQKKDGEIDTQHKILFSKFHTFPRAVLRRHLICRCCCCGWGVEWNLKVYGLWLSIAKSSAVHNSQISNKAARVHHTTARP